MANGSFDLNLTSPEFNLVDLNGNNGFSLIESFNLIAGVGHSVSGAGDINNDGFDDFIVGAPFGNSRSGCSYVVFGKAGGVMLPLTLQIWTAVTASNLWITALRLLSS